jgi:hypothetical protein
MNPIHNPKPNFYEFHFNIIVHVASTSFEISEVKIYVRLSSTQHFLRV